MTPTRAEEGAADHAAPRRSPPIGPRVIGALLLAAGLYLLVGAVQAASEGGLVLDGPRLAPIVVTGGWVVVAAIYLVRQLVTPYADYPPAAGDPPAGGPPAAGDPPAGEPAPAGAPSPAGAPAVSDLRTGARSSTSLMLLVALVGYAFALKYTVLGYVIATAAFFLVAARLLSTRPLREVILRDALVAIGLSLTIYLAFTRLLDISLPQGVFPL
jgi:putative tricarboxylic transport membrane protein